MKLHPVPLALVLLLAVGSLASAEDAAELLVMTDLAPADEDLEVTLPAPGPVELLWEETVPAPSPRLTLPMSLPAFKPVLRSGKALFDANLALMVGLNVADYVSTVKALKVPGLEETNPLMKPFVKTPAAFAAFKFGTTALSYLSMKAVFKKNRTVAWIMTTATNAFLTCVVANNIRQIQAARAR